MMMNKLLQENLKNHQEDEELKQKSHFEVKQFSFLAVKLKFHNFAWKMMMMKMLMMMP